jgi:uncharacterized protein (DUF362 family)
MKVSVFSQKKVSYNVDHIEESIAFLFESLKFKEMICRNDTVALKPNWIQHSHHDNPREWEALITHRSVITSVLEHVLTALNGSGRVIIADGPHTDASWDRIMDRMAPNLWKSMGDDTGVEVEITDLRDTEWITEGGVIKGRREKAGDPLGSTVVDLGEKSEFWEHKPSGMGYYGADYNCQETNDVHNRKCNKYKVSKSIIEADVFINLPKLKTHKKAGITCSLKNLVGISTYRNWLPHYTMGTPEQDGDQFPDSKVRAKAEIYLMSQIKSFIYSHPNFGSMFAKLINTLGKRIFGDTKAIMRSGNWYGNDTIWRTVLDLNKILLYANPDGSMREPFTSNAKRYLTIVDGIIGGEGDGPLAPDRVESGVLIGGTNAVAVDCVCAKIMGFDYKKIPMIYRAYNIKHFPLVDFEYKGIEVISNEERFHGVLSQLNDEDMFTFKPHFGWKKHIELQSKSLSE